MKKFVPDSITIPEGIITEDFKIRILTVNDLVKDYDAVMSSINQLKGIFGPNSTWPPDDLTIEQDLIDLGWHQKEFERKSSFTYTVMNLDETKCLGCIYIDPSEKKGFDAKIIFWARKNETRLDKKLFSTLKLWLSEEWWFESIAFPGRLISWENWNAIPNK